MIPGTSTRLGLALSGLLAVLALPAAAQVPTLLHSAPKLGSLLELEVRGATPGASVRLFHSRGAGSSTTPFGRLELDRGALALLASGQASASGEVVFQQQIPLDPALAEVEGHYQALVEAPLAPAGWVLSEAVHLRYIGTRLYATGLGYIWTGLTLPAELRVLSALDGRRLGSIPLAAGALMPQMPGEDRGEPVLSADLSRGAVVPSPDRLVVFDNFELEALAALRLNGASLRLLSGPDGSSALVLEVGPPARILWVDLSSAAVADSLALPWPVSPLWCCTGAGNEAWVGEYVGDPSRAGLRRVDLETRKVLEGVLVGTSRDEGIMEVCSEGEYLFATLRHFGMPPYNAGSALSVVDLSTTPASVASIQFTYTNCALPTPMTESGRFAITTSWMGGPSSHSIWSSSLRSPLDLNKLPPAPGSGEVEFADLEPDGEGFWALHPCCDYDGGPGALLHFSFASQTWTAHQAYGVGGPHALALARDGLVYQLYAALDGLPFGPFLRPSIEVLEVASGTITALDGVWGPQALWVLSVP
jgi:hypothetical protein